MYYVYGSPQKDSDARICVYVCVCEVFSERQVHTQRVSPGIKTNILSRLLLTFVFCHFCFR